MVLIQLFINLNNFLDFRMLKKKIYLAEYLIDFIFITEH